MGLVLWYMAAKKKVIGIRLPALAVWLAIGVILAVAIWMTVKKTQTPKETPVATTTVSRQYQGDLINLPDPSKRGGMGVDQALFQRRSRREWIDKAISVKQLGQVLWAMQGVTTSWGGRVAPSAKEAYPIEIYVVVNNVSGLEKGIYHYIPGDLKSAHHQLGLVKSGDFGQAIADAIVQSPAKGAAAVIIEAANFGRMTETFKKEVDSNVYLEAGHVAQNAYLEVESLGLGMVTVAGFDGSKVSKVILMPAAETPIYAIPVAYPQQTQG